MAKRKTEVSLLSFFHGPVPFSAYMLNEGLPSALCRAHLFHSPKLLFLWWLSLCRLCLPAGTLSLSLGQHQPVWLHPHAGSRENGSQPVACPTWPGGPAQPHRRHRLQPQQGESTGVNIATRHPASLMMKCQQAGPLSVIEPACGTLQLLSFPSWDQ